MTPAATIEAAWVADARVGRWGAHLGGLAGRATGRLEAVVVNLWIVPAVVLLAVGPTMLGAVWLLVWLRWNSWIDLRWWFHRRRGGPPDGTRRLSASPDWLRVERSPGDEWVASWSEIQAIGVRGRVVGIRTDQGVGALRCSSASDVDELVATLAERSAVAPWRPGSLGWFLIVGPLWRPDPGGR